VLGLRALNRATLARQMLLRRRKLSALEAVEHLVGMQAQAPKPPYVGLWTRLEGFRPEELGAMITSRSVVRGPLMRNTVHLVSARDYLWLRPLVESVIGRGMYSSRANQTALSGMDIEELAAMGRALLEERPLTAGDLGARLQERWPERDPASLARAIRHLLPLVQVPPRGVWGQSGTTTHTTAEAWTGRQLDPEPSLDELVLRYLGAFGPASVMDVQVWSGLSRLGAVVDRLRPRLLTFRDVDGRELFDLPQAPRPDPDTPVLPRFLPEFDNLILSHEDRTRVIADEHRKRIATRNGMVPGTILVDGFVRGAWRFAPTPRKATLQIEPFEPVSDRDREALVVEGEALLRFLTAPKGAGAYEVRVTA
jgi:hypothetical protein